MTDCPEPRMFSVALRPTGAGGWEAEAYAVDTPSLPGESEQDTPLDAITEAFAFALIALGYEVELDD